VLTTGIGTTSAGLTCAAVRDGGEWSLEAGALVLADRGVCCIDEFSSIKEADRATIHEAMEQQTLSVAKAGLVCKLNARATVFAVTNPKGPYDTTADVSANTAIASPLLSRFDVVLVLLDTDNAEWDKVVSAFILKQAMVSPTGAAADASASAQLAGGEATAAARQPHRAADLWPLHKLRAYLCWARETLAPELSAAAQRVLTGYYTLQRNADGRSEARTTIRLLESLVRISQAHARLMLSAEVTVADAVTAVMIVESSMTTSALMRLDSVLHSNFSHFPDAEYAEVEERVLGQLGLRELATAPPPLQQHYGYG
jgi:DNA helicase MCM9